MVLPIICTGFSWPVCTKTLLITRGPSASKKRKPHCSNSKILLAMQLTTILLLATCLLASAGGNSQRLSLEFRNAPIKQVFAGIEKQAGYTFVYTEDQLGKANPVSLSVKNTPVAQVLQLCFKGQPLTYSIIEKVVVVKLKAVTSPEDEVTVTSAPPPLINVKGRILNENDEPVAATVQVKDDKTKGTSTNEQGYFELKGVDENATLVITGVSIENFEVKLNGRTELGTLSGKTKITEGETVQIVNTGYQQLPKERATGSFVHINNELFNRKIGPNILDRLDGITSGLLFDKRDNNLSGFSNMQIHGLYTLSSGISSPLIVVDNFPFEGDLNTLNPNDIENKIAC